MPTGSTLPRIRRFVRRADGAAGVELGFGVAALLTISMLCFDLYAVVRVDSAGARAAVTLAEFVSRETAPNKAALSSLGGYIHRGEFEAPTDVAYTITAIQRRTGEDRAVVLWTEDTIRFGEAQAAAALATECANRARQGWRAVLLGPAATSRMTEGEVIVVAEVCARPSRQGLISNLLIVGDSYHLHVLPVRDQDNPPARPA